MASEWFENGRFGWVSGAAKGSRYLYIAAMMDVDAGTEIVAKYKARVDVSVQRSLREPDTLCLLMDIYIVSLEPI